MTVRATSNAQEISDSAAVIRCRCAEQSIGADNARSRPCRSLLGIDGSGRLARLVRSRLRRMVMHSGIWLARYGRICRR
jgi:hypothetical protein